MKVTFLGLPVLNKQSFKQVLFILFGRILPGIFVIGLFVSSFVFIIFCNVKNTLFWRIGRVEIHFSNIVHEKENIIVTGTHVNKIRSKQFVFKSNIYVTVLFLE